MEGGRKGEGWVKGQEERGWREGEGGVGEGGGRRGRDREVWVKG